MELITLQNDRLLVQISPVGAEIQRIRDAQGNERLWDGDPAFWAGRAPVLFPVAGGLLGNHYTLDGEVYTLGKHGFARGSTFAVEEAQPQQATFLLMDAHEGFPFEYSFRVRYTLAGGELRVQYITENLGDRPFWYGVGAHEAYACPGGIEAYELVFDEPESLESMVLAGGGLSYDTEPVPLEDGRVLRLHDGLFAHDTLVLRNHRSRAVTLRSTAHARTVRVAFADFDYLLLWKVAGADYLCIEPWSNLPDYTDTDHDITRKTGMIRLDAGAQRVHMHTITFA